MYMYMCMYMYMYMQDQLSGQGQMVRAPAAMKDVARAELERKKQQVLAAHRPEDRELKGSSRPSAASNSLQ